MSVWYLPFSAPCRLYIAFQTDEECGGYLSVNQLSKKDPINHFKHAIFLCLSQAQGPSKSKSSNQKVLFKVGTFYNSTT